MKEIEIVSDRLFVDFSDERNIAREVWDAICADPTFKYKLAAVKTDWIVPSWQGNLNDVFEVKKYINPYIVLSVDGSQIYPDRHQGTACHLINVGYVYLSYGIAEKNVMFNSVPHVFTGDEEYYEINESPTELVNCRRQEFEFAAGHELVKSVKHTDIPLAFFFDGSLIFWHLESKSMEAKQRFLYSYLDSLQQFYESKTLIAGYISLTKSKELLNLIRIALCDFVVQGCEQHKMVDHVLDAQIASFYLSPFERSTIFKNNSKITKYYPEHLHPHFFYMNIDTEIVRIEIPQWIAVDKDKVDLVSNIIADQVIKGRGYPVALAEAHEQAVVKGADREFFYHLINKFNFAHNRTINISQKSRKKLGMGI